MWKSTMQKRRTMKMSRRIEAEPETLAEGMKSTLDEVIRVIKRKIQDDPENSDRIRSILNNKYHREKVQELSEDGCESFLKEIRNL
jgi:hypothetical protein